MKFKQSATFSSSNQRGLTLVELLVSLALSGILMAGVAQVFVGMRQVERTQDELSRMQEAGRFAINFLAQDIRVAGYMGCTSTLADNAVKNTLNNPPVSFEPEKGIQGWEANGTDPASPYESEINEPAIALVGTGGGNWTTSTGNSLETTNVVRGTDVIKVWSAAGAGTGSAIEGEIAGLSSGATPSVEVSNMDISNGDILMLSDCQFADLIQSCSSGVNGSNLDLAISAPSGTCSPGNVLPIQFGVTALKNPRAVKLGATMFYIGKRGDVATNSPALFRRTLASNGISGAPEELVEGIEDMQVLYGENNDNDSLNVADYYVPADQVSNWEKVVSVRVSLLVQSVADNLVPDPQPYLFNGVTYNDGAGATEGDLPPDQRLRRVFTSTISLRNRTLGI